MLRINGMPDHLHILVGYKPTQNLTDLVRDIKACSSGFINDNHLTKRKFHWQEGYGAFSYCHSDLDRVINYIINQQEHHRKQNFHDEYLELLKSFDIDFEENYIFKPLE